LDISIISGSLFEQLVEAFNLFAADYKNGSISPRDEREQRLWNGNLEFADRNIPKGFFDSGKTPSRQKYKAAQHINNTMWVLVEKLKATPDAPVPRKASARVFQNWPSFVDRASLNLGNALNLI